MKIARVFPRKTNATPDDELVYINCPPDMLVPEIDEVHISVAFTYDRKQADILYTQWGALGVPVKVGGPAYGQAGGEFEPGRYMKHGYLITSRGCPNNCWFCSVWKREPELKELAIKDGWIINDDNLLACSDKHIKSVFEMLKRQPHRPLFIGGLESKILKPWHVELLKQANTERMYFAYDTPDDYEPLVEAGKMLSEAGYSIKDRTCCCYMLIGFPRDTFAEAEKRIHQAIDAGFFPFAMLYKNEKGEEDKEWRRFQRSWARPVAIASQIKEYINVVQ